MFNLRKIAITSLCVSAAALVQVKADQTTVSFDSGSQTVFNQGSTPLSGGTTADGDGDVLQLGYFTGANFTGTFIPLSGNGSLNTAIVPGSTIAYNQTSIGDLNANGAGDGTFAMSLDFVLGSGTSGNNLPTGGTLLALRFFNGTTVANSTMYNTVTDPLWVWQNPATPPVNVTLSLDDLGLLWESIVKNGQASTTAFHTSISTAIPEPSTYLLFGAGALGMMALRRRVKR
jgi:hypothetical protein